MARLGLLARYTVGRQPTVSDLVLARCEYVLWCTYRIRVHALGRNHGKGWAVREVRQQSLAIYAAAAALRRRCAVDSSVC